MNTPLVANVINALRVAESGARHLHEEDWELCCDLARKDAYLHSEGDAHLEFNWFKTGRYRVLITLGVVYNNFTMERELDSSIYNLLLDAGFSTDFSNIIIKARKEGYIYLLIDADA
jgi:hypothetical protein